MGNRNAGREAAPSASGLAITSPAALAAHLGRDLSASAVDDGGWTDLHYAAVFGWPAVARALLVDGAPVDARLKTDAEPLGPQVLDTLCRTAGTASAGYAGRAPRRCTSRRPQTPERSSPFCSPAARTGT